MEKVAEAARLRAENGWNYHIEVDGGIKEDTARASARTRRERDGRGHVGLQRRATRRRPIRGLRACADRVVRSGLPPSGIRNSQPARAAACVW